MKFREKLLKKSFRNMRRADLEKNNINLSLKTVLINFSHLAFGEFSSKAFGFLTTVYLARVLGVEIFGFTKSYIAIKNKSL